MSRVPFWALGKVTPWLFGCSAGQIQNKYLVNVWYIEWLIKVSLLHIDKNDRNFIQICHFEFANFWPRSWVVLKWLIKVSVLHIIKNDRDFI